MKSLFCRVQYLPYEGPYPNCLRTNNSVKSNFICLWIALLLFTDLVVFLITWKSNFSLIYKLTCDTKSHNKFLTILGSTKFKYCFLIVLFSFGSGSSMVSYIFRIYLTWPVALHLQKNAIKII